ncbi:MAG: hypothetical protein ABII09_07055 [Planctomycetota bacterium]
MNDNRRGKLSLLLSLSSFAATAFFFVLLIKALREAEIPFSEVVHMRPENMWSSAGRLFLIGWFPGSVLALVSFMLLRRSQGLHRLILVYIFSGLVIIVSVVWFFSSWVWLSEALPE